MVKNKNVKKIIGKRTRPCRRCGSFGPIVRSYNLNLCRQCFREKAQDLGFKKYS